MISAQITVSRGGNFNTSYVGTYPEESQGTVLGVFYGSYTKTYHVAPYVPYRQPPVSVLCGCSPGHLTGTGKTIFSKHRPLCEECARLALGLIEAAV